MQGKTRYRILPLLAAALIAVSFVLSNILAPTAAADQQQIQHLVVIFQENISFDHYFGTYPFAANPKGEPKFVASEGTPSVNGLSGPLLTSNPNLVNPFRLDRSQAFTCDQNHDYTPEQKAYDGGLVDQFVQQLGSTGGSCTPNTVMGYYDGNTVSALWNYAQNFAMSDNSYSTGFGPSTPGTLNLVSGQTHGATPSNVPDSVSATGTVIGDPDPTHDDCGSGTTVAMSGQNVGNLLNNAGVTWGWFQGGFAPTSTTGGKAVCGSTHANLNGTVVNDYSAHHEPFQYYQSTSNPHHLPPTSVDMIGYTDQANHQYDLTNFWQAVDDGNMSAVSFLKAAKYQDGHAGYSDPLDEQNFLVNTINHLESTKYWKNMAIIIAYDDSDGWYDHVMPPIVSHSNDPTYDALAGTALCGQPAPGAYLDRCGYGPRQPLLVISPFAKVNYVDHTVTDQASILAFIEQNWHLGQIGDQSFDTIAGSLNNMFNFGHDDDRAHAVFLDPSTGLVLPNS